MSCHQLTKMGNITCKQSFIRQTRLFKDLGVLKIALNAQREKAIPYFYSLLYETSRCADGDWLVGDLLFLFIEWSELYSLT